MSIPGFEMVDLWVPVQGAPGVEFLQTVPVPNRVIIKESKDVEGE